MPPSSTPSHPIHPSSRRDNPFATCWTTAGTIPFHFPTNKSAGQLITQLTAQHWRGAILGPHGSGKSTLLATLRPALLAADRTIHAIALRDRQRRLPADFLASATGAHSLLIIDGYEQLGWPARIATWLHCRTTGAGLLVTSHEPVRIPTLVRLTPDRQLIEQLISALCSQVSTDITREDIAASHACHGSNVREIFFSLYDRHEELRRASNRSLTAS